jgi:hypothetical protein
MPFIDWGEASETFDEVREFAGQRDPSGLTAAIGGETDIPRRLESRAIAGWKHFQILDGHGR